MSTKSRQTKRQGADRKPKLDHPAIGVTSIATPGMTTNTFAYNGFGARVSKSDSSGTTTYLRSGTSVVAPVVADSGAVYTPGISERRGTESRFYHGDIKNYVEQTDGQGNIASSQQYDAFGNVVSTGGGMWEGVLKYGGAFSYQTDEDYGLHLVGHRYYDSSVGRFLTRDPVTDGRNWYVYCDGNPVVRVDFHGEQWGRIIGGIIGGAAGALVGGPLGASVGAGLGSMLGSLIDGDSLPQAILNGLFDGLLVWVGGKLVGKIGEKAAKYLKGTKVISASQSKLQHIFDKHKADFGLSGNWSKAMAEKMMAALQNAVKSAKWVRRLSTEVKTPCSTFKTTVPL